MDRDRPDRDRPPRDREGMRAPREGERPGPPGDRPGAGLRARLRAQMQEPLSPDEEAHARELIQRVRPWELDRLEDLSRENPRAYQMLLRRALMQQHTLERLKQNDPEAHEARMREFEFERQEHDLSQQYQAAKTDAERAEVEQRLTEVLGKHFDLRTENHRREVKKVQEQLESLKKQLAAREQRRNELIEQMKLRLEGQGEMLEF